MLDSSNLPHIIGLASTVIALVIGYFTTKLKAHYKSKSAIDELNYQLMKQTIEHQEKINEITIQEMLKRKTNGN